VPDALSLPPAAGRAAGVRILDAGETLSARFEIAWRRDHERAST
jgi:hypothetical protein